MVTVTGLQVILNRVHQIDLTQVPAGLVVEDKGESPSIYTSDGYPTKRVQGLTLSITGVKTLIDAFLDQYKSNGVYIK